MAATNRSAYSSGAATDGFFWTSPLKSRSSRFFIVYSYNRTLYGTLTVRKSMTPNMICRL